MLRIALILFIFFILEKTIAQEQSRTEINDDYLMEKYIESFNEEDDNNIAEDIEELEKNPLDLNYATLDELFYIPFLNELIINKIIEKRDSSRFNSIEELKNIEGITPELFSNVTRFVTVRTERLPQNAYFVSRISKETSERIGYKNGKYLGSPFKMLNKMRISIGDNTAPLSSYVSEIKIGALIDKDPGEQNIANYSSGYSFINIPVLSSSLIIGDYSIRVAEGLVFGLSRRIYKGSNVLGPVQKEGYGLRQYLSSDENNYFRGIALNIGKDNNRLQLMYSNKSINAVIDSNGRITSIDKSGLFRTNNEINHYKSSKEMMIGLNYYFNLFDGFRLGTTAYKTHLSNAILIEKSKNKSEDNLWAGGINLSYSGNNYNSFAEIAVDKFGTTAKIGGVSYYPSRYLSFGLSLRNYPVNFHSIYSNSFGESNNKAENEKGIYFGIRFQLLNGLWISSYYDQFQFIQAQKNVLTPFNGNDFLLLIEYRLSKTNNLIFRFKQKNNFEMITDTDMQSRITDKIGMKNQQNYRFALNNYISKDIKLSNKIEWTQIRFNEKIQTERGYIVSQGVKWMLNSNIIFTAKITTFETESYNSRIYDYEEDLLGVLSNPVLFGKGIRWYLIMRYQVFEKVYLSAKYSETLKEGVKSMGSGNDEITGNKQGLMSVQIEIKF